MAQKSSISQATTLEEMGEFWDEHDFTDYDDPNAPDVEFTIFPKVKIEPDLFAQLKQTADQRGVSLETLVNLWLQEKLLIDSSKAA